MKNNFLFYFFSLFILFFFLELLFTVSHPELANNQVHKFVDSERTISKSKNTWYKFFDIDGSVKYRYHKKTSEFFNYQNSENIINKKNVFVFGDSVTGGFGVNLQDTYFYHAESLINQVLDSDKKINVFSIARFGDNFRDMIKGLNLIEGLIKEDDFIIYQFNFNDIVDVNYAPVTDDTDDTDDTDVKIKEPSKFIIKFNDWRKSFLNKSALIRVMQHYAGIIKWNIQKLSSPKRMILKQELFKKCGNLGFSTLGQYTYSFGTKQFEKKSLKIWDEFEKDLINLNEYLKLKKLNFAVIISPISLQIPHHEGINHRGLSFQCSTIDGYKKIIETLSNINIDIIDPVDDFIDYSKITHQNDNFKPLFHPYDTNHPNETGHYLMAKKLYFYLYNLLKV